MTASSGCIGLFGGAAVMVEEAGCATARDNGVPGPDAGGLEMPWTISPDTISIDAHQFMFLVRYTK